MDFIDIIVSIAIIVNIVVFVMNIIDTILVSTFHLIFVVCELELVSRLIIVEMDLQYRLL